MEFNQQILSHLAYELPQDPIHASCEKLIDPCLIASCEHEAQHVFDLLPEQDTVVKLEDITQPHPWQTFSFTSESRSSDTLEPVGPTPTSDPSRKQQPVKRPRRDRARSGSSGCSTDTKREKNRIAASKFRRKKKEEERIIEERYRMLQVQNRLFMDLVASLRSEVLSLKHEILRHGSCNFPTINTYIATAAARIE
ncbi:bzip transcription factor [Apiospora arundinis]|uniref:Bzip transcription factor n=1 Tax=Apiospora arundinis TaxID=335852 RepID=A0ABR2J3Q9_9PEZI